MAITVKHSKVSTIPDDADTSLVRPSDWNADHTLVGTIDVANGGTGATTANDARTNLGLGTIATQNANAVAITGGTINNATIGATTPSTGKFTTLEATGTSSLGTASAQYIQVEGNALYPQVKAVGSGTNIPLVLQPKGTGALQAQLTDSTATGGNARGTNAVDWQTSRSAASQVASGANTVIVGGQNNTSNGAGTFVGGGLSNQSTSQYSVTVGGFNNQSTQQYSAVLGGQANLATGFFNFIGGGFTNSGTANGAVTTQSATMNGTTAVTLAASNANIKVGQYIAGTSIANNTYVAAISGTALTLSQNASGSSTSTLSFFTPHGVVVGGGNNQATGSYSFIGGGGDAGTAANRNVASGDWSFVGGGRLNQATGAGSAILGGGTDGTSTAGNTASGPTSAVLGGNNNNASGTESVVVGGSSNLANGNRSIVVGATNGTTRGIVGNTVMPASISPFSLQGGSQSALLILGKQTTDATATVLTSNTAGAGGTNQVIMPNNSAYTFVVTVIAGKTAAGDTKSWELKGAIKRGANAASTAIVGTVTTTVIATDAGAATWAITATADTTNGGLAITVTGQAATTIRWVAKVETTEMTF